MRLPPIQVWQTFPASNYVDPPKSGNALIVSNVVFIALNIIAVSLRLYTRIVVKRHVGFDDFAITIALFFCMALGATVITAGISYGWDLHVWDVPIERFQPASICAFVAKIMFTMAATFTRVSLILFYYRLVKDTNIIWFRWVLHASMIWTICVCLTFNGITVFQCK